MFDIAHTPEAGATEGDPRRQAREAATARRPLVTADRPASANRRILLADDDHDILRGASLRLGAAGYETITVEDGERAISAAVESRPDAIVLDIRMPKRDGLSALHELRRQSVTREIPVVMLSASVVDEKRSLDAGARFFLRKPYRGSDLVAAVSAALAVPPSQKKD